MRKPTELGGPRYVIVGGDTPLGADLRETLLRHEPMAQVKLAGGEEAGASILTAAGGEATVITGPRAEELEWASVVFLAGSAGASLRAETIAAELDDQPIWVDLTRALAGQSPWKIRAPSIEPKPAPLKRGEHVAIAHPVAIALATILRRLYSQAKVRRVVATAYLPASEWGREGIDELHKQTINLLAFHRLPQAVFDTQLAFNLLAQYGDEAPASLESVSARVAGDMTELLRLAPSIPSPSLRILQAPCMHGLGISLWMEFAQECAEETVAEIFRAEAFDFRDRSAAAPSVVGMAAQDGIAIGAVERDASNGKAWWLFAAADNYRLMAQEAAALARLLSRAKGAS